MQNILPAPPRPKLGLRVLGVLQHGPWWPYREVHDFESKVYKTEKSTILLFSFPFFPQVDPRPSLSVPVPRAFSSLLTF
jgi:hypothetical protein